MIIVIYDNCRCGMLVVVHGNCGANTLDTMGGDVLVRIQGRASIIIKISADEK